MHHGIGTYIYLHGHTETACVMSTGEEIVEWLINNFGKNEILGRNLWLLDISLQTIKQIFVFVKPIIALRNLTTKNINQHCNCNLPQTLSVSFLALSKKRLTLGID